MSFLLRHYAGAVVYDVRDFLEKNRDAVYPSIEELIGTTTNKLLQVALEESQGPAAEGLSPTTGVKGARRRQTQGAHFDAQLRSLMGEIGQTSPHYIRCIKSNVHKRADEFDAPLCFEQLKYRYVCVGVNVCVYVHTHTYTYIPHSLQMHMYRLQQITHMHTRLHTYTHAHVHIHTYTPINTQTHAHAHIHTHTAECLNPLSFANKASLSVGSTQSLCTVSRVA